MVYFCPQLFTSNKMVKPKDLRFHFYHWLRCVLVGMDTESTLHNVHIWVGMDTESTLHNVHICSISLNKFGSIVLTRQQIKINCNEFAEYYYVYHTNLVMWIYWPRFVVWVTQVCCLWHWSRLFSVSNYLLHTYMSRSLRTLAKYYLMRRGGWGV